jgi:hypothetical protein
LRQKAPIFAHIGHLNGPFLAPRSRLLGRFFQRPNRFRAGTQDFGTLGGLIRATYVYSFHNRLYAHSTVPMPPSLLNRRVVVMAEPAFRIPDGKKSALDLVENTSPALPASTTNGRRKEPVAGTANAKRTASSIGRAAAS